MLHYFGGANFSKDRASFPPLPNVINGDRIQHHTLKPQPEVCKTNAETGGRGREEKKNNPNLGNVFRSPSPEKGRKEEQSRPHPGNASSEHLSTTGSPTQGAIPLPANAFKTQLAYRDVGGGVFEKTES